MQQGCQDGQTQSRHNQVIIYRFFQLQQMLFSHLSEGSCGRPLVAPMLRRRTHAGDNNGQLGYGVLLEWLLRLLGMAPSCSIMKISWNSTTSHQSYLQNMISYMQSNSIMVDVPLICKTGEVVKCHRIVLACASKLFRTLLEDDFKKVDYRVFEIFT